MTGIIQYLKFSITKGKMSLFFRQIAVMKGGTLVNDQYLMMRDFSRNLLAGQLACMS